MSLHNRHKQGLSPIIRVSDWMDKCELRTHFVLACVRLFHLCYHVYYLPNAWEVKRGTSLMSWGEGINTVGTSTLTIKSSKLGFGISMINNHLIGGGWEKAGYFMILKQILSTYMKRIRTWMYLLGRCHKVLLPSVIGSFFQMSPNSVSTNKWGEESWRDCCWFGSSTLSRNMSYPVILKDVSRFLPPGNAYSREKLSYGLYLMTFP